MDLVICCFVLNFYYKQLDWPNTVKGVLSQFWSKFNQNFSVGRRTKRDTHNSLCKHSSGHVYVYIFNVDKEITGLDLR